MHRPVPAGREVVHDNGVADVGARHDAVLPATMLRDIQSEGSLEIAVCGLSHHSAPIEVLEQLAFAPERRPQAYDRLISGAATHERLVQEAVILSTCNRVELYVACLDCDVDGTDVARSYLARFLADFHGLTLDQVDPYLYSYEGAEAARHLFGVAAGLDSLILGEPQILGQVRGAIEEAHILGSAGPVLNTLFRYAVESGKRAHAETGISQGAASVSYAAVEIAAQRFGELRNCRALVIGAGKTGQLAAQALYGRGVRSIVVANRSLDHADALAGRWGGEAHTLDELDRLLPRADIVISCTNAPGYVVGREQVAVAAAARIPDRPLLLLDIAMPRDIDPRAAEVPGVQLYNVDDLRQIVEGHLDERRDAGRVAEAIVERQVEDFMAWISALAVTPVITDLRGRAEVIRQRELERFRNRFAALSPDDIDLIDMMTHRIVNQLLHEPTVRLKQYACRADGQLYVQAVRDLFALDPPLGQDEDRE